MIVPIRELRQGQTGWTIKGRVLDMRTSDASLKNYSYLHTVVDKEGSEIEIASNMILEKFKVYTFADSNLSCARPEVYFGNPHALRIAFPSPRNIKEDHDDGTIPNSRRMDYYGGSGGSYTPSSAGGCSFTSPPAQPPPFGYTTHTTHTTHTATFFGHPHPPTPAPPAITIVPIRDLRQGQHGWTIKGRVLDVLRIGEFSINSYTVIDGLGYEIRVKTIHELEAGKVYMFFSKGPAVETLYAQRCAYGRILSVEIDDRKAITEAYDDGTIPTSRRSLVPIKELCAKYQQEKYWNIRGRVCGIRRSSSDSNELHFTVIDADGEMRAAAFYPTFIDRDGRNTPSFDMSFLKDGQVYMFINGRIHDNVVYFDKDTFIREAQDDGTIPAHPRSWGQSFGFGFAQGPSFTLISPSTPTGSNMHFGGFGGFSNVTNQEKQFAPTASAAAATILAQPVAPAPTAKPHDKGLYGFMDEDMLMARPDGNAFEDNPVVARVVEAKQVALTTKSAAAATILAKPVAPVSSAKPPAVTAKKKNDTVTKPPIKRKQKAEDDEEVTSPKKVQKTGKKVASAPAKPKAKKAVPKRKNQKKDASRDEDEDVYEDDTPTDDDDSDFINDDSEDDPMSSEDESEWDDDADWGESKGRKTPSTPTSAATAKNKTKKIKKDHSSSEEEMPQVKGKGKKAAAAPKDTKKKPSKRKAKKDHSSSEEEMTQVKGKGKKAAAAPKDTKKKPEPKTSKSKQKQDHSSNEEEMSVAKGKGKKAAAAPATDTKKKPEPKKGKSKQKEEPHIAELRKAKCELTEVQKATLEWEQVDLKFRVALHGRNKNYNEDRLAKKLKPIHFILLSAEKVTNKVLEKRYEAKKKQMTNPRECLSFHGTHPKNINSICTTSLLRFNHPLNPCLIQSDDGWFGTNKKGVYVSMYADYTLKYANNLQPLNPLETCKIIMFKTLPGTSHKIPAVKVGIDPTPGYDSHTSPSNLEYYLFDEAQLCPEYVLNIQAIEDTRTAADDGA